MICKVGYVWGVLCKWLGKGYFYDELIENLFHSSTIGECNNGIWGNKRWERINYLFGELWIMCLMWMNKGGVNNESVERLSHDFVIYECSSGRWGNECRESE